MNISAYYVLQENQGIVLGMSIEERNKDNGKVVE